MKKLLLTLFVVMLAGVSLAQPLSGDKMIPGDYNSIVEAVDDLNLNGVDSPGVTFLIESDYVEEITAPITITVTGTSAAPIVFQKNGGGNNPVITRTDGGSLNTTSFGAAGDAIIRMEGTDFITFDGISLTANLQGIEYGYLTHKPSGTDGCQNVTIKNAVVTMNRGNSGVVIGIYIGNGSVSTTSATGVTVTSLAGKNANILITGNTVQGAHSALVFRGSSASGFADDNITIGVSGEGNLLHNYGGGHVSSAHGVYMIYATNVNISYNTFDNSGGEGSPHNSTLYGVFLSSGVTGDIVMNNNDITLANTAASSGSQGLYSANTATSYTVNNNTFSSGTITSTGTLYLIYLSSSCQNVNVSGNQINGTFTRSSASGTMYAYYNNGSPGSGTENIYNNDFSNISVSGTGTFYGIYSNTAAGHTANIYNNVVSNITAGTGTIYGVYGAIANTRSIYGNDIYGFNNSGIIYGIYVSGGNPALVYNNEVYNLTSASSSATTTQMVNGIYIAGGTNTYLYNNYISDLHMPNSPLAAAVGGICVNSGTNAGLYYNTIFLNTTGSTSTFGTSGIFVRGTSSACDLRNNNIVNISTPGETGYTVGIRWAAAFNPAYYANTSNNNNIYCGEPDANHLIYFNGTEGDQIMEDYQLRVSPMDAASFSEDPPFINSLTTPYDLRLSTTVSTQCESGGIAITIPIAIDSDFDGNIRQGSPGYTGTGTAPDVGAHEFEGIPAFTCGTPNPGNTLATKTELCAGESVTLSLENAIVGTGNSFQWQSSPDGMVFDDIPDATALSYTTTPVEEFYYRCVVVCQNGPETAYSVPVQVTFSSHILSVTPGTRCGIGTVELAAEGESGIVNWYDAASGGNLLGTGNTFTTPVISETTTYYAADVSSSVNETGGKPAPVTTLGTTPSTYGLVFTAYRPFTLNTFDVYPNTANPGNIVVELRDNTGATLITSAPIPIPGGDALTPYTVNIGWSIPVGEGLRILILSGGPSMVRESSGNSYPYPIGSVGLITSGYISGTSNAYYYMYNWTVTANCESPSVPVVATVTPAPEIEVTATPPEICEGQSSVLLATSVNDPAYDYVWEPGTLVGATHIVTPLTTQLYGVTATDNSSGPNDGCVAIGSVEVIVHPLPPATVVTPSSAEVENGDILMLTASGGGSSGSGQIGTGTLGTATSTPYKGVWGGTKNQMIYTADELTAIGMKPGSLITAISFNATAFTPPYTYLGFTVAMKNTATSVMTTTAETGVTTVFGPVDYAVTETAPFTITHTLDVPFAWDGTSNLLVETCFNNNDAGTTSKSVSVQYTSTTGFSRTLYISKDNTPTLCTEPPTGTTTTTRPNIHIQHELIFPKTWAPLTYLYSDPGATIPYTGEAAAVVYTEPMTSVTYTATSTTPAGCTSAATAVITSCPAAPANLAAVNVTSEGFDLTWDSSQGLYIDPVVYTVDVATDDQFTNPVTGSPFVVTDPVLQVSVGGLTANTQYYYRINAEGECISSYSSGSVFTCPSAPANLGFSGVTTETFTAGWDPVTGALYYTVEVCTDAGFTAPIAGSPFTVVDPLVTLDVTGLTGNTTYYVRVSASSSCSSEFTSGSVVTCPAAPGGLAYSDATSESFELSWNFPAGGTALALTYTVEVATDAGFLNPVAGSPFTVVDPVVTQSVSGLSGNTIYYVRVKAYHNCAGDWSSIVAYTCPDTPANLTLSDLTYTSFNLSWSSSAGGGEFPVTYEVDISTDGDFLIPIAGSPFTITDPDVSLSVSGLISTYDYYYRVKAIGNCSSLYAKGRITTPGCDAPADLVGTPTSGNTANLSWTAAVIAPPLGYEWEVRTSGAPGSGATGLVDSGTTSDTFDQVTGLTATTSYFAYVRSHCDPTTYSGWISATFTTLTCPIASIPYLEDFEAYTPPAYGCLTVVDANDDAVTWFTNTGPTTSGTKKMTILKAITPEVMDDWVYTMGLPLQAGHVYTVNFWYRAISPSYMESLKVNYGMAPDPSAMSATPIFDNPAFNTNTYTLGIAYITPTVDGIYWIGFHCYSGTNKAGIYIDDLAVCEGPYIAEPITGPNVICKPESGVNYSIPAILGATNYVWSVPSGATIVGGTGTNAITVDFSVSAVSGNVTVYGENPCGVGNTATLAVTVGNPLPVSVDVVADNNPVCEGTEVLFTAGVTNGGTSPTYQWWISATEVTGATDNTYSYVPADGDEVYCVVTSNLMCASGNPATSNIVTMEVNPILPVSVTIAPDADPVCAGTTVTYTATPVNGGASPSYQWFVNTVEMTGFNTDTYAYIPADGDQVYCILTSSETCQSGGPATSNTLTATVNPILPVSVTILADADPVCAGTTVTYTATPVNGGASPSYQWFVNTVEMTGFNTDTYAYIPADGDQVYCILTSSETCQSGGPATSNTLTAAVNPILPVSVTILADADPVCAGTTVTYTAAPVNGGASPSYQWFVNTVEIIGFNTDTYAYIPANGDQVYCILTSSETCQSGGPATSNILTATVNPLLPVSVTIAADLNDVCAGTTVTFTATPVNGGLTPSYQWFVNSVEMIGFNTDTYAYVPADGDQVYCILTSSETCQSGGPATSNTVVMIINPILPVSVTIAADADPVCAGTTVTYTATPVNGGLAPTYQWFVNTVEMTGFTTGTYAYIPVNGDQVYCILTSSEACKSGSPATSNTLTATVNPILPVSVSIAADLNDVCAGTTVTYTATPVNGGLAPTYQWFVNTVEMTGFVTDTYSYVPADGDQVYCILTSSEACQSGGPATSNTVTMIINPILPVSVTIAADADPVCDGTTVTYTATPVNGGSAPTYQWFVNTVEMTGFVTDTYAHIPANGDQVYCILTSSEACQSGGPATSNTLIATVNSILPVSVTISADANPVCAGTTVTYTAAPVNGGLTPTYQWFVNTVEMTGFVSDTYSHVPADGDQVYCILTSSETCQSGGPATSNTIVMTVTPLDVVSVTIDPSYNPVCTGSSVLFTAYPVNAGTNPTYQWSVNGLEVEGATNITYEYIPVNGDQVYCTVTTYDPCITGSPAVSNIITMEVKEYVPVSVYIEPSGNPFCEGNFITFTAYAQNAGATPVYDWYVNTALMASGPDATFTYLPANFDEVYCTVTSSELCTTGNPATSESVVLNIYPVLPVSITIDASATGVCEGSMVLFTASPVNGGLIPAYQWKLNDMDIIGATESTYSYYPANGDVINCVLTSSLLCKSGDPATSNAITMTVDPLLPVSITIEADQTEVCTGTTVNFTSLPVNGGMSPQFQWQVNSTDIAGATTSTFSFIPVNGDVVSCILTSSEVCATGNPATSNAVGIVVNPILPVSVSIVVSSNPVMIGNTVTFTATPVNGGTTPDLQWVVNGFNYANGTTFSYMPVNGDQVYCVLTSSEPCTSGNPATSNTITMTVLVVPVSVSIQNVTIEAPEALCYNATELITVAGPPYSFVIEPGGSAIMIAGVKINYLPGTLVKAGAYMHGYISNVFCDGVAPPITAAVTATEEVTMVIDKPAYTIFPNPTRGNFTIRQKGEVIRDNVEIEVYSMTGERIITEGMIGERQHEVVFNNIPDGIYFVRIISGSDIETVKLIRNR